jgi:hypothetical protein
MANSGYIVGLVSIGFISDISDRQKLSYAGVAAPNDSLYWQLSDKSLGFIQIRGIFDRSFNGSKGHQLKILNQTAPLGTILNKVFLNPINKLIYGVSSDGIFSVIHNR